MKYCLRWVLEGWVCVGHVDLMLFVSFLFALGIKCKHIFLVEYGLVCIMLKLVLTSPNKAVR